MDSFKLFNSIYGRIVIAPDDPTDSPERNLCCAILRDAIEVATGISPSKDDARDEAQRWLIARDDDWIFPCSSVCALVKIDQEAMLKAVVPKFVPIKFYRIKKKKRRDYSYGALRTPLRGCKPPPLPSGEG